MKVSNTGELNFNWPAISGADSYKVSTYVNFNLINNELGVTDLNYNVNNLTEGDDVYLKIYKQQDGLTNNRADYITNTQVVPVYDFHADSQYLNFESFEFNEISYSFSGIDNYRLGSVNYITQSNNIHFNILNPRNTGILQSLDEEPFLKSLTYKLTSDTSTLSSGSMNTLNFNFNNSYKNQNITGLFVLTDFYDYSITGAIDFINPNLNITQMNKQFVTGSTGDAVVSLSPKYSYEPSRVDYQIFDNINYNNLIISGTSNNYENINFNYPINTTGYLKLTPQYWNGDGEVFLDTGIMYYSPPVEPTPVLYNNIKYLLAESNSYSGITVSAQINQVHTLGSYALVSIDSSPNTSFNENSYFTGFFEDSDFTFAFDFFNNRTGYHPDWYINLDLYKSGTNQLEDSQQTIFGVSMPEIQKYNVQFDYGAGYYYIDVDIIPDLSSDAVTLLYSGSGDNQYYSYTGNMISGTSINVDYNFQLINTNTNFLYDSIDIHETGLLPVVGYAELSTATLDNTVNIILDDLLTIGNVSSVKAYRKPSFEWLSGVQASRYSGHFDFLDYKNYHLEDTVVGHWIDFAPVGIDRNRTILTSETGYYESGRHYIYRFEGVNGFGTGVPSAPTVLEFPSNEYQNKNLSDQIIAESDIVKLDVNKASLSDNQVVSGENTFTQNVSIQSEPSLDYHAATKLYVDNNAGDSIRKIFSSFNSGSERIVGSGIYLSNILYDGYINIDNQEIYYERQSLFYPIECSSLQAENPGQMSYFLVPDFTGYYINPSPSPSVTPTQTITPTPSFTPSATPNPTLTPTPSITPTPTLSSY